MVRECISATYAEFATAAESASFVQELLPQVLMLPAMPAALANWEDADHVTAQVRYGAGSRRSPARFAGAQEYALPAAAPVS